MFISHPTYRRIMHVTISLFMLYMLWLAIPTVSEWVIKAQGMTRIEIEYYLKTVVLVVVFFLALTSAIYTIILLLIKRRLSFFFFFYAQVIGMPAMITASVHNSFQVMVAIGVAACIILVLKHWDQAVPAPPASNDQAPQDHK